MRKADAPSRRPLLAIDVDGVIALFGVEEAAEDGSLSFELVDGVVQAIPAQAGAWLRELARHYDLVWATGWEARANQFSGLFGLPGLPYLSFDGAARFGSADWKLEPLAEYAKGRALAWIDDSFDELCYSWARARQEPTLLIPTESDVGLGEVQVEALIAWARGRSGGG